MSLKDIIEQITRIFPYILEQLQFLKLVLVDTKKFFRDLEVNNDDSLRNALKFTIFLIIFDILVYLPVDALLWKLDPLSPPIVIAGATINLLQLFSLSLATYISLIIIFRKDSLVNCVVLSCYTYSFIVIMHISEYPSRFFIPVEIIKEMAILEINFPRFIEWLQRLSTVGMIRLLAIYTLMLVTFIFITLKLAFALSSYLKTTVLRAVTASFLTLAMFYLWQPIIATPIFIQLSYLSR